MPEISRARIRRKFMSISHISAGSSTLTVTQIQIVAASTGISAVTSPTGPVLSSRGRAARHANVAAGQLAKAHVFVIVSQQSVTGAEVHRGNTDLLRRANPSNRFG